MLRGFEQIYVFERRLGQRFCEITIFTLTFLGLPRSANYTTYSFIPCLVYSLTHSHIECKKFQRKSVFNYVYIYNVHSSECGKYSRLVIVPQRSHFLLITNKKQNEKMRKHITPTGFKFMNTVKMKKKIIRKIGKRLYAIIPNIKNSKSKDTSICRRQHEICMPTQNHIGGKEEGKKTRSQSK